MILKIGLGLIFLAGFALASFGVHYGAFKKVEVSETDIGPFHIVYRELEGVNSKAIQEIKTEMQHDLASLGIAPEAPFDIFYPEESGEPNKIGFEVDPSEVDKLEGQQSIKAHVIEKGRFITATFSYKGPFSYVLAFMKVDPAFRSHRKQKGYAEAFAATRFEGDHIFCLQPIVSTRLN